MISIHKHFGSRNIILLAYHLLIAACQTPHSGPLEMRALSISPVLVKETEHQRDWLSCPRSLVSWEILTPFPEMSSMRLSFGIYGTRLPLSKVQQRQNQRALGWMVGTATVEPLALHFHFIARAYPSPTSSTCRSPVPLVSAGLPFSKCLGVLASGKQGPRTPWLTAGSSAGCDSLVLTGHASRGPTVFSPSPLTIR